MQAASKNGLRAIAAFEAAKGLLVLLAGAGLLALVHHDVQRFAETLVGRLHLNPSKHYPRIFIDASAGLTDARMWKFAALAAAYSLLRFVEAYGLWHRRLWGEWCAVATGGLYLFVEIYEITAGFTWIKLAAFTLNAAMVVYLVRALLGRKHG